MVNILYFDLEPYYRVIINQETKAISVFSDSKWAKGRLLSQYKNADGYSRIKLNNKHVLVHHLVAKLVYGEKPDGLVINHKDGNKANNLPENLEYITQAENIQHAIRLGLHVASHPEKNGRYKDGRCVGARMSKYKRDWAREKYRRATNLPVSKYRV